MNFSQLHLHPKLKKGLQNLGFDQCTPVQEKCIPYILQGCDISALAPTGTGKTGAFLLPLMDRVLHSLDPAPPEDAQELYRRRGYPAWKGSHFVLVLVPTRELALQVHKVAESLSDDTQLKSALVYGGVEFDKQKQQVPEAQFIIATPGRLIDLYKDHIVDLNAVRAVVFDEADQMFDLGFRDDMRYILRRVPRKRQLLMLGATARFDALHTAYEFHSDPIEIDLSQEAIKAENVNDSIFHVGQDEKERYLLSLLKKEKPEQVIVFSNFKSQVEWISRVLVTNGQGAVGISSLLSQPQRQKVMQQFRDFKKNILVATDVAARGLDVKGLDMVINFDLPMNPANYVHRIGRTGRAGKTGVAYSLVSERDVESMARIEDYIQKKLEVAWLDDEHLLDSVQRPRSLKKADSLSPRHGERGSRRSGPGASRTGRSSSGYRRDEVEYGRSTGGYRRGDADTGRSSSDRSGGDRNRDRYSSGYRRDVARGAGPESRRSSSTRRGESAWSSETGTRRSRRSFDTRPGQHDATHRDAPHRDDARRRDDTNRLNDTNRRNGTKRRRPQGDKMQSPARRRGASFSKPQGGRSARRPAAAPAKPKGFAAKVGRWVKKIFS